MGAAERSVGNVGNALKAVDYKTGKVRWSRPFAWAPLEARWSGGLLSTAGGLLFGNDGGNNFVAYDAATGKPLWHAGSDQHEQRPADLSARRRQYVVVGAEILSTRSCSSSRFEADRLRLTLPTETAL